MFFIYLRRELRRRMRQAVFIALGLALGIGLVITVSAASDGVKNSQATVLHSLYGVGTDITVTQPPAQGSNPATSFGFRQEIHSVRSGQIAAGTSIDINHLANSAYGTLGAGSVARVARQHEVTGASGGLTLTDVTVTGTVPSLSAGRGSISSSFTTNSFTVDGVDLADTALGPLSAAKLTSGANLTAADATSGDAVVDSGYAAQNNLKVNSAVNVGGTRFKVIGIVSVPQGGNPPDIYIPLAKAQSIGQTGTAGLTREVNTIYVSAASAADIPALQRQLATVLPHATVTDQSDLASQVTGSLSSASSLASNLGTWLSAAVLIAAFGLAVVLTMAAVARRVREFGTLKALGWRSRRIIGQVMGESIVTGLIGGALGVGLGYAGVTLIDRLAPPLSATVGSPGSGATPGTLSPGAGSALRALTSTSHTVSVSLSAPVTLGVILLAVLLAIGGGLVAGSFGGWRAARLRPAAALARVE
ncbi:MAG TPA: ABC transporter permease [Streptosporangiaceae bacterium]|jgi:putative ABC transport system permease protein|nr:ABC transporter permease [Streptosporangiaceae bacterium]